MLDIQIIFHLSRHDPAAQRNCPNTNPKTFVDDCSLMVTKRDKNTLSEAIAETMQSVQRYTDSNRLMLNAQKTTIMIVSKDQETMSNC